VIGNDNLFGFEERVSPNEHGNDGASTPEAIQRIYAVGAIGLITAKHAFAPPNNGQVTKSPKVHRCEGHLASGQIKWLILTLFFCSSAVCSPPAAKAPRRSRKLFWHRPTQVRATHSEGYHGQRARHHDQVPTTHKERRRGRRPEHHGQLVKCGKPLRWATAWPTRSSTCVVPHAPA
jgi:hypothetical protein